MQLFKQKSDRFFNNNNKIVNNLKINKTNNYILYSQINKTLINLNVSSTNDTYKSKEIYAR